MAKLETLEDARKHRYGTWGGNPSGHPYQEGLCMASVFHDYHSWQRSNKIWRDGFCRQHHPETLKAKKDKADAKYRLQQEKWNQERMDDMERKRKLEDYDSLKRDLDTAIKIIDGLGRDTQECDIKEAIKDIKNRRNYNA